MEPRSLIMALAFISAEGDGIFPQLLASISITVSHHHPPSPLNTTLSCTFPSPILQMIPGAFSFLWLIKLAARFLGNHVSLRHSQLLTRKSPVSGFLQRAWKPQPGVRMFGKAAVRACCVQCAVSRTGSGAGCGDWSCSLSEFARTGMCHKEIILQIKLDVNHPFAFCIWFIGLKAGWDLSVKLSYTWQKLKYQEYSLTLISNCDRVMTYYTWHMTDVWL